MLRFLLQVLKKKERDYEHEMERLAREKINTQQKLVSLKKELAATWDHIDFNTLLPEHNMITEPSVTKNGNFSSFFYRYPKQHQCIFYSLR